MDECFKAGEKAADILPDKPAKARQKDTDARWTVKFSQAKLAADGVPQIDIATPTFRLHLPHLHRPRRGLNRCAVVTNVAAHDGARLREGLIDPNNTASRANARKSAVRAHIEHPLTS